MDADQFPLKICDNCFVLPIRFKDEPVLIQSKRRYLLTGRTPLYRVQEFYQQQDVAVLLGPQVQPSDLNNEALAYALDKLSKADLGKSTSR